MVDTIEAIHMDSLEEQEPVTEEQAEAEISKVKAFTIIQKIAITIGGFALFLLLVMLIMNFGKYKF